jgi:NAD(P)-dependent dehydrogenase (short-subunit alcohol dehydrogenase family)
MQNSYTNKIVLVTGGTSGIGQATALAFAEAGAKVVITGRREKEGADVAEEITKTGGTAAFVRADVAKDADVAKAIDFVLSSHGRLDVAFNNAGVEIAGPLNEVTGEQYRRTFDINVWGVLNSMKHEIAAMLKTGGGAIVNTSSVAGHIALPQASISLYPVGRLGASEEIAAAVLYLASDAAKFTTGTTLLVDGGWTAA